jgi:hypothetical protein
VPKPCKVSQRKREASPDSKASGSSRAISTDMCRLALKPDDEPISSSSASAFTQGGPMRHESDAAATSGRAQETDRLTLDSGSSQAGSRAEARAPGLPATSHFVLPTLFQPEGGAAQGSQNGSRNLSLDSSGGPTPSAVHGPASASRRVSTPPSIPQHMHLCILNQLTCNACHVVKSMRGYAGQGRHCRQRTELRADGCRRTGGWLQMRIMRGALR